LCNILRVHVVLLTVMEHVEWIVIQKHIHTYIHTHTFTHIHTDTHSYTHIHTYTQTHTYTHVHTHTKIHTHKLPHKHTYTHTHTHTYRHIHTHITIIERYASSAHYIQTYTDGSKSGAGVGAGIALYQDNNLMST